MQGNAIIEWQTANFLILNADHHRSFQLLWTNITISMMPVSEILLVLEYLI